MIIKDRKKFPIEVRHHQCLKGISIGGCVNKKRKIGKHATAHAHCRINDKYRGWICFHDKSQIKTQTIYHEVAHLLVNSTKRISHHGKIWFDKFIEIGGKINKEKYGEHLGYHFPWLKKYMKS
jgi:hypothetical protein